MEEKLEEMQNILLEQLKQGTFPLPRIIHVETRSKCNGKCAFCLASIKTDPRGDVFMPDSLIEKIINELSSADYPNRLSFYNNNDPFIDKRIYEIIRKARKTLPKAYLELKTNGKALNTEKVIKIFNAGLDTLYINDYVDNDRHSEDIEKMATDLKKIRRFKGHLDGNRYYSRIIINCCDANAIMGTRAGSSPNREEIQSYITKPCFRPFEMMTISPEGKVSVCSEDFYYSINMGNVNDEGILDIWQSNKWTNIRYKLVKGQRNCIDACSKCDYRGFTYEMLREYDIIKEGIAFKQQIYETNKLASQPGKLINRAGKRLLNWAKGCCSS